LAIVRCGSRLPHSKGTAAFLFLAKLRAAQINCQLDSTRLHRKQATAARSISSSLLSRMVQLIVSQSPYSKAAKMFKKSATFEHNKVSPSMRCVAPFTAYFNVEYAVENYCGDSLIFQPKCLVCFSLLSDDVIA